MDIIIPIDIILRKVRAAHASGVTECPFPLHSAAALTWQFETARLQAKQVTA